MVAKCKHLWYIYISGLKQIKEMEITDREVIERVSDRILIYLWYMLCDEMLDLQNVSYEGFCDLLEKRTLIFNEMRKRAVKNGDR